MKAVVIADDDGLIGHLEAKEVDVLISLGDLWDSTIEKAVAKYQPHRTFAVRGNHDSDAPFPAFVTPLHRSIVQQSRLAFAGFNGSWR